MRPLLIVAAALLAASPALAAEPSGWGQVAPQEGGTKPSWSGNVTQLSSQTTLTCQVPQPVGTHELFLNGACLGVFDEDGGAFGPHSGAQKIVFHGAEPQALASWTGGSGLAMHTQQSQTYCALVTYHGVQITSATPSGGNIIINFKFAGYTKDQTC